MRGWTRQTPKTSHLLHPLFFSGQFGQDSAHFFGRCSCPLVFSAPPISRSCPLLLAHPIFFCANYCYLSYYQANSYLTKRRHIWGDGLVLWEGCHQRRQRRKQGRRERTSAGAKRQGRTRQTQSDRTLSRPRGPISSLSGPPDTQATSTRGEQREMRRESGRHPTHCSQTIPRSREPRAPPPN